jgi:hypothetical protein
MELFDCVMDAVRRGICPVSLDVSNPMFLKHARAALSVTLTDISASFALYISRYGPQP